MKSPDETYENLTEELIFPPDEKSPPLPDTLPDTLPGQVEDSENSPITNSSSLFGQIGEGEIDIDSIKNSDFMNIENPEISFEDFMQ